MEPGMHVLIIEDDKEAAGYVRKGLRESGHTVTVANTGDDGLMMARGGSFDVLVVDRMLPDMDGTEIIQTLRSEGINTPALILSALSEVGHRVEGLRAGGDDYLTKPFAFSELLARLEALMRRANPDAVVTEYAVADLKLDLLTRRVSRGDEDIELQPREFTLLAYLMKHAGQVVTRTMLLENVWDYNFDPQTNVVDVHISRLRAKIDKGFEVQLLATVRGAGYRMVRP
jgi:two-component system, OmpR family, response regulator